MPYPIFKDSTGKELHFIGMDKAQLDDNKKVSDEVTHLKNAQSRRRSLPVPSRRWIIDWKNNGSLKGNFGKRLQKPSPKVNFVRAKKRHLKNQQADKVGLEATNSPKK